MRLKFDGDKCTGCRLCQLVCAATHESVFTPESSRLRVNVHYRGDELVVEGHVCNLCGVCVEVCPCAAIEIRGGTLVYERAACTGCGVCASECPQGVITVARDGSVRICDMCAGQPLCAEWCSHGAIWVEGRA